LWRRVPDQNTVHVSIKWRVNNTYSLPSNLSKPPPLPIPRQILRLRPVAYFGGEHQTLAGEGADGVAAGAFQKVGRHQHAMVLRYADEATVEGLVHIGADRDAVADGVVEGIGPGHDVAGIDEVD